MKAVKRPIPIEVIEFQPSDNLPEGVQKCYDGYAVWNETHKSLIPLEAGDFLNVTNENDLYPIKKDIFHATYDVI